ncbi:unnamed protein product [Paramecium octaurelia]|uniref:DNA polymerase n=1 Tax=Paramecium octaurelia TaxID=43137 RepID=A0A8S1V0H5_PAROT|nr:unnamed protein product [Paramecium octaurelia]
MSEQQRGLEELARQKRQAQLSKNPPVKREKIEGDLEDFIVKDIQEDEFYANDDSQEEEIKKMPDNQQQITQYMGQNRKKKQTGIKLSDDADEIEQVIQQVKVEKVSLNQVVTNSDELYKAQFNQPLKPKQKQEIQEEDLDEILSLLENQKAKEQLKKEEQQQAKAMQSKQLPIHRQVEVKVELPQMKIDYSTVNLNQIIQGDRDVMDIVEKNGSILFYWIDIYEDQIRFPGSLFVFGKVKNHKHNVFDSCSLYFEDYRKTVYLSYENGKYTEQQLIQECQALMKKVLGLGSKDFTYQFVDRQYAFEIADIPTNQQQYLEVSYTLKHGQQLPVRIDNPIFKYALQSTQTLVEQFLIYNKIRGPCWLQLKSCQTLDTKEFHIRTQHALQLPQTGFQVYEGELPLPNLKLLSFALTQCKVDKEEQIIAISYTVQNNIDLNDAEVPEQVVYQTLARMPSDAPLPPGYIKGQNKQVKDFESEYSMLSQFLSNVEAIDPDGLVGHEIQKKSIEQLVARIAKLKVNEWNRMSRLQKREQLPKNIFLRSKYLIIGRLVIDLWVQAKDMIKSNDYSITYLAKEFLKQDCQQLDSDVTKNYTENAQSYQTLLQLSLKETKFVIQITQKLNIISLTRQLTNICGNVWNRSLLNQRAERNEMLLMHEFFLRGFLLPDKMSKINLSDEEKDQQIKEQESKKTYGGGLVFEPKADIYTQYVLLLDFNSLYPSIIMEYNICFTTVQRDKINFEVDKTQLEEEPTQTKPQKSNKNKKKKDQTQDENDTTEKIKDFIGSVDPDAGSGILPQIIEKLVNMRKQAKKEMSRSTGLMKQIYNIKQLAVKLVANSIYGCLGFSSSRFYAVGIASLITQKGRSILMDSKNTVERNNDVIYGDTDSMMICARQEKNLSEILVLGTQIAKEINKKYKKLVLAIDGVFDTLLLMKKKKYAGIKIDNLEDLMTGQTEIPKLKREVKGIDIVRREFCDISKKMQSHVLDILLETKNRDDIHGDLITLMQEIRSMFDALSGNSNADPKQLITQNRFIKYEIPTSDFIIVKQLNKAPHEYADTISAPHVQVALRMVNEYGRSAQSLVNHFIRYVICDDPTQKNLSFRAYTVDELINKNLTIDYYYYLSTQIFDPIVRLCKNVQVISIPELAQILGLKTYQYKDKINHEFLDFKLEEEQKQELAIIDSFKFKCPVCKDEQKYSQFFDQQKLFVKQLICQSKQCSYSVESLKSISNQTKLMIKKDLSNQYYKGYVECNKSKSKSTNFCRKGVCFGSCCEKQKEKKVSHVIDEETVNIQVKFITQFLNKVLSEINKQTIQLNQNKARVYQIQEEEQFHQPFCYIRLNDIFRRVQI